MPVPETTSAESFERYVGGKCLRVGDGNSWRDIKAWTIALPRIQMDAGVKAKMGKM